MEAGGGGGAGAGDLPSPCQLQGSPRTLSCLLVVSGGLLLDLRLLEEGELQLKALQTGLANLRYGGGGGEKQPLSFPGVVF